MVQQALLLAATLATCLASPNIVVVRNESPQCSKEGRYADSQDCGQYYDCVRNPNNGIFVAHQRSCFGNAFHPDLKACVPREMIKGCIPSSRSGRNFNVADPRLDEICNAKGNTFFCADCKTLVICVDGTAYTDICENEYLCSKRDFFKGDVCYPGSPKECSCNEADIFRTDLYDPSKFLECGIVGSEPNIHSCLEGLVFDEKNSICVTEIYKWTCTAEGTSVVEDDCTKYFTCIFTTKGYVHKEFTCPNNTMFNDKTGKCEDPCDWYSDFTCAEEGRFTNPSDCTKYYECVANPLKSGGFIMLKLGCPEGFEWNQKVNGDSGHCVARRTTKEKCLPLTPKQNTCIIPNEWCTTEVNECMDNNGGCDKICTNVFGSFNCSCDEGFYLDEDQNSCIGKCPEGNAFEEIGGTCYYLSSEQGEKRNWDQSRKFCQDLSGNEGMNGRRVDLAELCRDSTCMSDGLLLEKILKTGEWHWLGASEPVSEDSWKWTSGRPLSLQNSFWHASQPDHDGDCLVGWITGTPPGPYIGDWHCDKKQPFVCQIF